MNDLKDGKGNLTYKNGDNYYGEFKDDKRNGKGKLKYTNGDYYVGEFKDDKKEGSGTYFYKDGDYYEGDFKDDNRHSKGRVYNPSENKERCKGKFKNGDYQTTFWDFKIFNSQPHCY